MHTIGWFGALSKPESDALAVQRHALLMLFWYHWIISANTLDIATITWC